jgi:catechol 2,3-dioxygenase-like lactoylglutathione lyase family enzyme
MRIRRVGLVFMLAAAALGVDRLRPLHARATASHAEALVEAEARSAKVAHAQTPAAPPPSLVVGSGNFFSPIVGDLDKAVAFYRDGLGLDVQGTPSTADANPALRNMFGLPDAQLRWQIGRPPAMRTGVEIVEITKAARTPIERRVQDSGAFMLIVFVRDVDATFARVKALGAPVVTIGGTPIGLPAANPRYRVVVVKDPDGHFVEIVQADQPPETQAPPSANVIGVRVRLTVEDVDKALKLYRDSLGMTVRSVDEFKRDPDVNRMLGLKEGQYRVGMLEVPTTGLIFEVLDFKGVDRRTVRGNIQDPGSTRIQLQVRDVDAAIDALKRHGGAVVSSAGTTVNLPGRGGATTKVAIVRDPDNLFLVLLQAAPPAPRN